MTSREPGSIERIHEIPVRQRPQEARCIPFSHLARRDGGRVDLHLAGALPSTWLLGVARGLAERRVNLLRGWAAPLGEGLWSGFLEIDLGSAEHPVPDFVGLAISAPSSGCRMPEPPLLEVGMADGPRGLDVEVHAWDAVGLLASVLGHVETVGLVAHRMLLETEGECAFHNLTLRERSGALPESRRRRALARRLAAQLRAA